MVFFLFQIIKKEKKRKENYYFTYSWDGEEINSYLSKGY